MTGYRPTTLVLEHRHCPAAIRYHDEQTPWAHDLTYTGTAAHAFLEMLGRALRRSPHLGHDVDAVERLCDGYHSKLIAAGRSFDGQPRPPLPAHAVEEGKHLALRWVRHHGLDPDAYYEVGVGFAATPAQEPWPFAPYNPGENRFRCILDVLAVEEDEGEDEVLTYLVVRDYKTAWTANREWLDNLQQRVQALAAIAWAEHQGLEWDGVRIEIANLRTLQLYQRELHKDSPWDRETLAEWRKTLSLTLEGLDRSKLEHRPGLGCADCPYWGSCTQGQEHMLALTGLPGAQAEWLALHEANLGRQLAVVRKALQGAEPELHKGVRVGYLPRERSVPSEDAARGIVEAWLGPDHPDVDRVLGLVLALGLTLKGLRKASRQLYDREDAQLWVEAHTEKRTVAEFRVERTSMAGGQE